MVYACSLLTASLGFLVRRHRNVLTVLTATMAGSLVVFLATNFASWAGGMMYPRTAPGLWLCSERALPFLRNSRVGDLASSALLFGAMALAEARIPVLRRRATRIGTAA